MKKPASPDIVYRYKNGLYVNLTNRCPTACDFCVKRSWRMKYRGYDLNLKGTEPGAPEVIRLIKERGSQTPFSEIVFCGYGEPTLRLPELLEICRVIKKEGRQDRVRIRLNTVGLGNLIWGRDIAPELKGNIDAVHVSLNTSDPGQWLEIMKPSAEFRKKGFESVLSFIASCAAMLPETTVTAVENPAVDIDACRLAAEKLGASFRPRPLLENEK